jgi:hypothetical protein
MRHWMVGSGRFEITCRLYRQKSRAGIHIPGTTSPGQPNCVPWHVLLVGPEYGICFMAPLAPAVFMWLLEF